ncbi:MAG TPA: hypothetical protein VF168_08095, partial [Trueperaceae bacterium]
MRVTTSKLFRWAGVALIVAGAIFAGIQPIHPPDVLESVSTGAWSAITTLKLAMCLLFLLGIVGLYARQAEESGWLGFAGFLLLCLSWGLQSGFVFTEVFVLPVLSAEAPTFVNSFLGIINGSPGEMEIGALPIVYNFLVGLPYMLGGVLLGFATFRAAVLPRWAGALLAVAALLTPAAALFPLAIQRFAAIPVAVAFIWLGYALVAQIVGKRARASLSPAGAQA